MCGANWSKPTLRRNLHAYSNSVQCNLHKAAKRKEKTDTSVTFHDVQDGLR